MQQASKKVGTDLTQGSIAHILLTFAFPMMLTGLIQQLYSMVDLITIGQFVGSTGTVGVSTGGELSDIMTPISTALALGAQICVAQLAGAKLHEKIRQTVSTSLTFCMTVSFVFTAAAVLLHVPILRMLNCPEEAFSDARAYMLITAAGMPFVFGYNCICSLLRGMGESRKPLLFIIVASVANIFLDLFFVVVIPWGVAGVAIATVGSQVAAFTAAARCFYRYREAFGFELKPGFFRIYKEPMVLIIKLGIPQLIRILSVNFSMIWVKSHVNAYGLVASSTYSIGNKIEKFMNLFTSGVDQAAGAMIGQNLGAKRPDRVRRTVWTALLFSLVFSAFSASVFLFFPHALYRVFTIDEAVIASGRTFLRIMSTGCFAVAFSGAFKSMATGAGAAMLSLVIGVLDGVMRIAVCLVFFTFLDGGVSSYFWGAALCQIVPGIVSMIYFLSGQWRKKKLLFEK